MRNFVQSIAATAILLFATTPTMATEKLFSFNVSPASCRVFALPSFYGPIHIVASQSNTGGDPGVADVTLFRDKADSTLVWVATDDTSGSVHPGNGFAAGTHIAALDYGGGVNLEVQGFGHLRVCNTIGGGTGTIAVKVSATLFW